MAVGGTERHWTSSWEDVPKLAPTSSARAVTLDVRAEAGIVIPLVRADVKKQPRLH